MSETINKDKCQIGDESTEEIPKNKNNNSALKVDNQRKKLTRNKIILIISLSSFFLICVIIGVILFVLKPWNNTENNTEVQIINGTDIPTDKIIINNNQKE